MNTIKKMKLSSLKKKLQKCYEAREKAENVDINIEIDLLIQLAKLYDDYHFDKDVPHAEIYAREALRSAASLGHVPSQFAFGRRVFQQARFWETLAQEQYGCQAHRDYAAGFYREAFTYLHEADEQAFAPAKRLLGLASIQGWGVEKDLDKGLKLVVDSIQAEGRWEQAKEIVEALGLDPNFFFAELANRKK